MKCPKCGSELEIIYPDGIGQFGCPLCKLAENELLPIAIEKLAKAESELKAIKAIWADGEYLDNAMETLKLIEKIGGEK